MNGKTGSTIGTINETNYEKRASKMVSSMFCVFFLYPTSWDTQHHHNQKDRVMLPNSGDWTLAKKTRNPVCKTFLLVSKGDGHVLCNLCTNK